MDRSWVYRVITYLLITLAAVVVLTPTVATWYGKDDQLPGWMKKHIQKRIMLGLDLQGGLHLVYEVQVDKAVSDKCDRLAEDISDKLHKDKKVKANGQVQAADPRSTGVAVSIWREGRTLDLTLEPGLPDVTLDPRPAARQHGAQRPVVPKVPLRVARPARPCRPPGHRRDPLVRGRLCRLPSVRSAVPTGFAAMSWCWSGRTSQTRGLSPARPWPRSHRSAAH